MVCSSKQGIQLNVWDFLIGTVVKDIEKVLIWVGNRSYGTGVDRVDVRLLNEKSLYWIEDLQVYDCYFRRLIAINVSKREIETLLKDSVGIKELHNYAVDH